MPGPSVRAGTGQRRGWRSAAESDLPLRRLCPSPRGQAKAAWTGRKAAGMGDPSRSTNRCLGRGLRHPAESQVAVSVQYEDTNRRRGSCIPHSALAKSAKRQHELCATQVVIRFSNHGQIACQCPLLIAHFRRVHNPGKHTKLTKLTS